MKAKKRATVYLARILAAAMIISTFATAPPTQARAAEDVGEEIVAPAGGSENITGTVVYSTSFEDDGHGWTDYSGPAAARSTDAAYTGDYSLAVTDRVSGTAGAAVNLTNQIGPVDAGQYRVSVQVKLLADEMNVTGAGLRLQLKTCRSGSDYCEAVAENEQVAGEWTELEGQVTITEEDSDVWLCIMSAEDSNTASFYVDDVTVTKVDDGAPGELEKPEEEDEPVDEGELPDPEDPDLTPGEAGQLPQDTIVETEPNADEAPEVVYSADFETDANGFTGRSATAERSQDAAHGGSWSLKVTGRNSNWKGASVDITNKVASGETYTASAWVKLVSGEAADATLQLSAAVKTGGSESYKQFAGAKGKATVGGDWIQLTGTLTMENWDAVVLYLETTDNATASFYIDDVVITKGAGAGGPEEPDDPIYTIPEPEIPVLDPDLTPAEIWQLLQDAIADAEAWMAETNFPIQISRTEDGSDVDRGLPWMREAEMAAFRANLEAARVATEEEAANAYIALQTSINTIKADGSNPYFRFDPGDGQLPVDLTAPTNAWNYTSPMDYRVPKDFAGGTVEVIDYPFADAEGKGKVLQINYAHNGRSTFGGITVTAPLDPVVDVPAGSNIEFDVYYPKSGQGKYMRWRIATTSRGASTDTYMRDYDYNNLNPDWIGSYMGETWLMTHHSLAAPTGTSSNFILELHGENARPAETGTLIVANIKITMPDPDGIPLPAVDNKYGQNEVKPLKSYYNRDNDLFMVGAIGTGAVTGTRARHYEIFVDGNNLKADSTHRRAPAWLTDIDGNSFGGTESGLAEYSFPTDRYQAVRDSGEEGEYKVHGHVMAWYNQAPSWMTKIIPEHLENGYSGDVEFYGLGNGVTATAKVDKETAKRVQFNHTMYVMRHFMSTDEKYGSSEERGIIPFNSWDILNEEIHESRHSELIPADINGWRKSLKHTNWLVAMSDDDISGDITDHYIYLLFKYAHIAVPNQAMADAYKANYDSLPEYMKLDGHDNNGSIDEYVVANPPKLTYNDYGTNTRSKARTIYNMVLELNTAWQSDPLYDGRPLIEDIGFQGHDSVGPTLASDSQYAIALFAKLIDEGLLSGIAFSEFDLKLLTTAPGGSATAPATLNVKQSDALGYQYALMYKLFTKFATYIDHIISWGVAGSGWQGSYVLFDQHSRAGSGYYAAMNPDRFIQGHAYLDDYFAGELEKLADNYPIDLGDLGIYVPSEHIHKWAAEWSSNENGHWHECTGANCTAISGFAAHTSDGGVVTTVATPTTNGVITYSCTVCGYVILTKIIPATDIIAPGGGTSTSRPGSGSNSGSSDNASGNPDPGQNVTTQPDGSTVTVETGSDGTKTTTIERPDGTVGTTTEAAHGGVWAQVTISAAAASEAGRITLPVPAIPVTANAAAAATVTVTNPSAEAIQVAIPVQGATPGTVAVLVNANGTEQVIKSSIASNGMLVFTVPSGNVTVKIVDNGRDFADTVSHWSSDAVQFVTARDLFSGTSETTFSPNQAMTRGMLMTVLARYAGEDTNGGSTWYEKGVAWAVGQGISDGTLPDKGLSRQELAVMLYRYAGQPAFSGSLAAYPDGGSTAQWAQEAMAWAVVNGIIQGQGSGELDPEGPATRAQVATMLMRFITLMA